VASVSVTVRLSGEEPDFVGEGSRDVPREFDSEVRVTVERREGLRVMKERGGGGV